jgi:hypothetical protein
VGNAAIFFRVQEAGDDGGWDGTGACSARAGSCPILASHRYPQLGVGRPADLVGCSGDTIQRVALRSTSHRYIAGILRLVAFTYRICVYMECAAPLGWTCSVQVLPTHKHSTPHSMYLLVPCVPIRRESTGGRVARAPAYITTPSRTPLAAVINHHHPSHDRLQHDASQELRPAMPAARPDRCPGLDGAMGVCCPV